MKRKLLAILLTLVMLACAVPLAVTAETAPPTSLGAPEHFGVSHYYGASLYFTLSASEDLRDYIEKWKADSENHTSLTTNFQVDYKIDNGSWHHASDWDSPQTVPDGIDDMYMVFGYENKYNGSDRWAMTGIFPEDENLEALDESGWEYLKSHSVTFRARFAISFDYDETFVLSPWSEEFTLSARDKKDYNKLINHAPSLVTADLGATPSGEPYFLIKLGRIPGDIQDLHSMAGGTVRTEVWMRGATDKDFRYIDYEWANEETIYVEASDCFPGSSSQTNYDAESYEIKVRYALDLREYKQAGYFETASTNVDIYSPFSNVISHNMPAWSNASQWATTELMRANEAGLIPDILKGADMTGPITREEFAELAVKLYEKTMGIAATPASPNPFTDTKNPEILKAFKLGITTGTSATTFAPKALTNREQVATMLSRAIRGMAPGGDFSTAGAPTFSDKKDISSWALDHVLFMARLGIIKGSGDKFMPKATTTAQTAAGYATTTREQAIAMSVRSFDQMDTIKESEPAAKPVQVAADADGTSSVTGTDKTDKTGSAELKDMDKWIVGIWTYSQTSGNVGFFESIEFKNDGSFEKGIGTIVNYTRSATGFKGNYKISGNKLTLYNQLKSQSRTATEVDNNYWVLIVGQDLYKDIPLDDAEYQISRTDDDKLSMSRVVDQTPTTVVLSRVID